MIVILIIIHNGEDDYIGLKPCRCLVIESGLEKYESVYKEGILCWFG